MHVIYREVSIEDAYRILEYCRHHNVQNGGLFEVYSTPGQDIHMVIVNSCPEDGPLEKFRPLGSFSINYLAPGTLTLEEDDPHFDGADSRKYHVAAIKQMIDLLIKYARPGHTISFNDLPAISQLEKKAKRKSK